jgi:hypothetical protein
MEAEARRSRTGERSVAAGKERAMKANVGDRVVVRAHRIGEHERRGEVLEVHGEDGAPPYLIRWLDDRHEGLVFPGSDVTIEHVEHRLEEQPNGA